MADLILASASPRRRELLSLIGIDFTILPADIDETFPTGDASVREIARDLAMQKTRAIAGQSPGRPVLAADTIVALEGDLLAKPGDADEAREMLERLRDRTHLVVTGVALAYDGRVETFDVTTEVTMRDYAPAEVEASIERGDPFDKAGGYAIQDPLFRPVARYSGCYTNVIGLPLGDVVQHLSGAGLADGFSLKPVARPGCMCCPWVAGPALNGD